MNKEDFRQYGGSTPVLSLNGLKSYGRLIDIYDGDTIKVILPFLNSYYKFTIRLSGIDTCEIKSSDKLLQENGIKARNRIFELLTKNSINSKNEIKNILESDVYLIWVECLNNDKYGRILANIYTDKNTTQNISEILLEEKLAYKYEGKKKLSNENIKEELNI